MKYITRTAPKGFFITGSLPFSTQRSIPFSMGMDF